MAINVRADSSPKGLPRHARVLVTHDPGGVVTEYVIESSEPQFSRGEAFNGSADSEAEASSLVRYWLFHERHARELLGYGIDASVVVKRRVYEPSAWTVVDTLVGG